MKTTTIFKTILTAGLLVSQLSFGNVWENTKQWNQEEEMRYSQWVKESWKSDMFTNTSSPYYGFITDCADAGYTMRLIYSYENGLPFQIYSKLKERTYNNSTTRFDRDPDGHLDGLLYGLNSSVIQRAKQDWEGYDHETKKLFLFQRLIMALTSTWTLPHDTISVKMGKGNIRGGMVQLQRRFHTYTIKDVDQFGNIINLASTLPPKVRSLSRSTGYKSRPERIYEDAVLAFRWPEESRSASHMIRRNSTQQHSVYAQLKEEHGSQAWHKFKEILKYGDGENITGLSSEREPYSRIIPRVYKAYCDYVKDRVAAVQGAIDFLEENDNRCMNATEYNNYSTPGRDKKVKERFMNLVNSFKDAKETGEWSTVDSNTRYSIENLMYSASNDGDFKADWSGNTLFDFVKDNNAGDGSNTNCSVNIDGENLDLGYFTKLLLSGKVSSNPHDNLGARWGLSESDVTCPTPQ